MKSKVKIGDRYGNLIVIERAQTPEGIQSKGRFWECRCDCGNKVVKPTRYFRMSFKYGISCGCKNVDPVNDLSGRKFQSLLVIARDVSYPTGQETHWICKCDCGKELSVRSGELTGGTQKSCGCYRRKWAKSRTREKSTHWKGGKTMKQGYVCIRQPEHPNAAKNGYVKEHILVMSNHLGRPLKNGEMVHHKNGDRTNNDLSNLELCWRRQPPGQRVSDMVKWAWEVINAYDADYKKN